MANRFTKKSLYHSSDISDVAIILAGREEDLLEALANQSSPLALKERTDGLSLFNYKERKHGRRDASDFDFCLSYYDLTMADDYPLHIEVQQAVNFPVFADKYKLAYESCPKSVTDSLVFHKVMEYLKNERIPAYIVAGYKARHEGLFVFEDGIITEFLTESERRQLNF